MTGARLPADIVWQRREFPNANLLMLLGPEPTLVDTGFVSHAEATATLALQHAPRVSQVVNTHWHSDHVGGNALIQRRGAVIIGSLQDGDALERLDPGCCVAEHLDQPVPQYSVDRPVSDGDRLLLGDAEWETLEVPGHTPGHLAFWNAADRVLAVGDVLSSYDVGWVNVMLDGPSAIDVAIESLERLRALDSRIVLPGHGPLVTDPAAAIDKAVSRLQRQRSDLDLAVDYGAKRILAFALMIRGGMTPDELDGYLGRQPWAQDAAALLGRAVDEFARRLVDGMLASGALELKNGTVRTAAPSSPVDPATLELPFPREWAGTTSKSQRIQAEPKGRSPQA